MLFWCSLAFFRGHFDALGLSFGALGPSFEAVVPQIEKNYLSGANWGRIRGPNRAPLWLHFSFFFENVCFGHCFLTLLFLNRFLNRFLAAPG